MISHHTNIKMTSQDIEVVVARWNEDVSWLEPLAPHVILYNKGDKLDGNKYKRVVQLANVGRESYSYLYHIVENYDTLAPITVFTQARIDDHVHNHISEGNGWTNEQGCKFVLELAKQAAVYGQSQNAHPHEELGALSAVPTFNLSAYYQAGLTPTQYPNLGEWYKAMTSGNSKIPTKGTPWYRNALFAVRRERIRQHPLSFYKAFLKQVDQIVNPEAAHYFERTWFLIFSAQTRTTPLL